MKRKKLLHLSVILGFTVLVFMGVFPGCSDSGATATPTAIAFGSSSEALYTGDTVTLSVTSTDSSYTLSSSNEAVATVSSTGVVTGVGSGTAVITATTTDGTSASCTIAVSDVYVVATNGNDDSGYFIKYNGGFGNGVLVDPALNSNGNAYFTTDVFTAADGTIYISGMYDDGTGNYIPCYWVKAPSDTSFTRTDLDTTADADYRVYAVYEEGGTVYTAGSDSSGYACMWKDTTINSLNNNTAGACVGLFVDGGTVYLSGRDADSSGNNLAYYWVVDSTGSVTSSGSLVTDTNTSEAFSVTEKDGTVYLAGFHNDGTYDLATFWEIPSGGSVSETTLIAANDNDSSYASSLFMNGDTLYIGGMTVTKAVDDTGVSASTAVVTNETNPTGFYSWYTKDSGSSFTYPVGQTENIGGFDIAVNSNNGDVLFSSMYFDGNTSFYNDIIKGSAISSFKDASGADTELSIGDGAAEMIFNSVSVTIH